jgi:hypothetical protein
MDPEEKRKELEREILKVIEEKLSNGQMNEARARAIAKMVLEKLHPPLTLEQIYKIAPTLDDEFKELSAAILPTMQEHDEETRAVVAQHAESLIRSGKIDEATNILNDALKKD